MEEGREQCDRRGRKDTHKDESSFLVSAELSRQVTSKGSRTVSRPRAPESTYLPLLLNIYFLRPGGVWETPDSCPLEIGVLFRIKIFTLSTPVVCEQEHHQL